MNTPLKSTFYCIGFLVILLSCKKESKKYSHDIGYIDPATALGDKEFKTCSDRIYEYYNFEPYAGYKYGKRALRDSIAKKYSAIGNESGYLTFRFVVNCKGSAGRYQIIENDLDLKPKKFGAEQMAQKVLQMLNHCDLIYVSFDVDAIDSRFSTGTGTPVPNGLTVEEAKVVNAELCKDPRVCAWEIVEINPTLDTENRTAESAFEILEAAAKSVEMRPVLAE